MKIGLINFELAPAGIKQLLDVLIKGQQLEQYELKGISINPNKGGIQYYSYDEKNNTDFHRCFLQTSPLLEDEKLLSRAFEQFDAIVVIGTNESMKTVHKSVKQGNEKRFLFVPVSIHNDIEGADISLGYDTAMNNIIKYVLKIKDTVESLQYENPRLFGIQIPGKAPKKMLGELSVSLGCYFLPSGFDKQYDEQTEEAIKKIFVNGKPYSFLIFDETIQPESIPSSIISNLDVDWKMNTIDQSICAGNYPTSIDRILAIKLGNEIIVWIRNKQKTGKLFFNNQKIMLQENI